MAIGLSTSNHSNIDVIAVMINYASKKRLFMLNQYIPSGLPVDSYDSLFDIINHFLNSVELKETELAWICGDFILMLTGLWILIISWVFYLLVSVYQ